MIIESHFPLPKILRTISAKELKKFTSVVVLETIIGETMADILIV
jgi:hypothetical protein